MHECLKQIEKQTGYDASFDLALRLQPVESGAEFQEHDAMRLFKFTDSGRISQSTGTLFLNYCPLCGEKLRE